MATLRGTTNSFFLGTSSQVFKLAGDIALLIVAVAWLGMGLHAEFKADDDTADEGDAVENMEKSKEDEEKKKIAQEAIDKATVELAAKTESSKVAVENKKTADAAATKAIAEHKAAEAAQKKAVPIAQKATDEKKKQ